MSTSSSSVQNSLVAATSASVTSVVAPTLSPTPYLDRYLEQYQMEDLYKEDKSVKEILKQAALAKPLNPHAVVNYAVWLREGIGGAPNLKAAYDLLRVPELGSNGYALYELSWIFYLSNEQQRAEDYCNRALALKCRRAFITLGKTEVTKGDSRKAEAYFKIVLNVDKSYTPALYELGSLYFRPEFNTPSKPSEYVNGFQYLESAAELGNPHAQRFLMDAYLNGKTLKIGLNLQMTIEAEPEKAIRLGKYVKRKEILSLLEKTLQEKLSEAHDDLLSLAPTLQMPSSMRKSSVGDNFLASEQFSGIPSSSSSSSSSSSLSSSSSSSSSFTPTPSVTPSGVEKPMTKVEIDPLTQLFSSVTMTVSEITKVLSKAGAFEKLKREAESSSSRNSIAKCNYAFCLRFGIYTGPDLKQAVKLYREATDLGSAEGCYCLGLCFEKGSGVLKDSKMAEEYFIQATALGSIAAMNNLSFLYIEGREGVTKDVAKGLNWLKQAAALKNKNALYNLGWRYESNDRGVTRDIKQAIEYYEQAVALSDAESATVLGSLYFFGAEGVEKDVTKSLDWLKKAVKLNDNTAMYKLAKIYAENDQGVPQDLKLALKLLKQAAERNNIYALLDLGHVFNYGKIGVTRSEVMAIEYYIKVIHLGISQSNFSAVGISKYELGMIYFKNSCPSGDLFHIEDLDCLKKAIQYFTQAASLKHEQAKKMMVNIQQEYSKATRQFRDCDDMLLQIQSQKANVIASVAPLGLACQNGHVPVASILQKTSPTPIGISGPLIADKLIAYLKLQLRDYPKDYDVIIVQQLIKSLSLGYCKGFSTIWLYRMLKQEEDRLMSRYRAIMSWNPQNEKMLREGRDELMVVNARHLPRYPYGYLAHFFEEIINDLCWAHQLDITARERNMHPSNDPSLPLKMEHSDSSLPLKQVLNTVLPRGAPALDDKGEFEMAFSFKKRELIDIITLLPKNKMIYINGRTSTTSLHVIAVFKQDEWCFYYNDGHPKGKKTYLANQEGIEQCIQAIAIDYNGNCNDTYFPLYIKVIRQKEGWEEEADGDALKSSFLDRFSTQSLTKEDIDRTCSLGYTALIMAARNNDIMTAKVLLKKGASINAQNARGMTALMEAAYEGHIDMLKLLIEYHADVNIVSSNNVRDTAVTCACCMGNTKAVKLLIDSHADIHVIRQDGATPLALAAWFHYPEIVKILINSGANVNDRIYINGSRIGETVTKRPFTTALFMSVAKGYTEMVKTLIEHKADVDMQDYQGMTTLMLAESSSYTEITKFLRTKATPILTSFDKMKKNTVPLSLESSLVTDHPKPTAIPSTTMCMGCFTMNHDC